MTDPLSIGGLGLAVASLTAQAFVGCIQVIQLIGKAKDLKPEFQYLNIRLQLERQRLWNWSEASGLLEYLGGNENALDASLTGLNRHLILEVVFHIQTLVIEFVKVKGRYQDLSLESTSQQNFPAGVSTKGAIVSSENDTIDENSDLARRLPGSGAAIRKLLRTLEITQQLPKRIRWATWDQDKFKGLVERLKELNDCLLDLVDNSIKTQVFQRTKESNMSFLELHNKMDDLRQLFLALAVDSPRGVSRLPLGLHPNQAPSAARLQEEGNKNLQALTRFKALSQSIENGTLDVHVAAELQLRQPGEQMRDSRIDRADVKLREADLDDTQSCEGLRCEALYCGRPVWVEWKEYQPVGFDNPSPAPTVLARVQKLAALLRKDENPAVFRVPHCLGYFDDAQHDIHGDQRQTSARTISSTKPPTGPDDVPEPRFRFGFVFAKPSDDDVVIDPAAAPVSLFELLQGARKPCLSARVQLARILANCVRYLHSVNWLHKGLRSHNVIFFPGGGAATAATEVDYSRPYLTGFDYARPAWREEMTESPPANPEYDVYRHPRLLRAQGREGYKKAFDVYSLGLVLVEIAEWKSVDVILGIANPKNARATEVSAIRDRLLNGGFMEEVGASMGSLYRTSVCFCLGENGQSGKTENAGLMRQSNDFYEKVVRHLEDIRC